MTKAEYLLGVIAGYKEAQNIDFGRLQETVQRAMFPRPQRLPEEDVENMVKVHTLLGFL